MLAFLFQSSKKSGESVKVVVRCRPMNEKEIAQGHQRYLTQFFHSKENLSFYSKVEWKTDSACTVLKHNYIASKGTIHFAYFLFLTSHFTHESI